MRGISLAEANRIIEGTFASARERKAYALAAIVLDAGGRVKAFQKQDGASLMRFEIAYGKAFGALALNRSSRQVLQKAKEKPPFMASLTELADGPIFLEAGGQLIRDVDRLPEHAHVLPGQCVRAGPRIVPLLYSVRSGRPRSLAYCRHAFLPVSSSGKSTF